MPSSPDLEAAARFMAAHARVLDRRRFALLLGDGDAEDVLAATEAYRNADGGYGWGLEPDLRAPESQPAGALHALEAFEDAAVPTPRAAQLCDWLAAVALPGGALPFALPLADPAATAPFWAGADHTAPSLQITAAVAAAAHGVARHDAAVAGHPWLADATSWCLGAVSGLDASAHAYELMFALRFLDAVHDATPEAAPELARLAALLPPDGKLHVAGGTDQEFLRPLDIAPFPARPVRAHLRAEMVEADLDRMAARQGEHGGWEPDWDSYSPAARLEWCGHLTVRAVRILRANDRI